MKKFPILTIGVLMLAGCANGTTNTGGEKTYIHVEDVNVGDRIVTCLTYKNAHAGGLDCDWDTAR